MIDFLQLIILICLTSAFGCCAYALYLAIVLRNILRRSRSMDSMDNLLLKILEVSWAAILIYVLLSYKKLMEMMEAEKK